MRKLLITAAAAAIAFAPFTVFAASPASADKCDDEFAGVAGGKTYNMPVYELCERNLGQQQPNDACAGITSPDDHAICEATKAGARLQP
jgi:hypothetical protein